MCAGNTILFAVVMVSNVNSQDILVPMVQLASSSNEEGFINVFAPGRIIAYQPWWPTHARRLKVNSNSCRDSTLASEWPMQFLLGTRLSTWPFQS